MRLLVLADEPPPADPLVLATRGEVDAVITLGDLTPASLAPLRDLDLPRMGVHGNHDAPRSLEGAGIRDLQLTRAELGGWSFAGFDGSVRHRKAGPYTRTQDDAAKLVRALPVADVLVCHCPPEGINDEPDDPAHVGYAALRGYVEQHRPRYLLHGHTTPDPRTRTHRFGATEVVWVRGARTVELRR